MTTGERIKRKREEKGWSQRELANRMGYKDHTTLTRVESDRIDLPTSKLAKFADILGVTPAYLMGWEDEPEDLGALAANVLKDPELLQLVMNFSKLGQTDRAAVSALVSSLATKKTDQ